MIPPGLRGPIKVTLPDDDVPANMSQIEAMFPDLRPGGRSRPSECTSRHRVAIIVPYRDRDLHLRTFLYNIHSFLSKQVRFNYSRTSRIGFHDHERELERISAVPYPEFLCI